MSAFDRLVDRVHRFKRTGPHSGIGSCPTGAHKNGDRSRGLSIRGADDRVLIYCHAGCGAGDIVAALGLTLGDLYDAPLGHHYPPSHSRVPARDLLEILDTEALVVGALAARMVHMKDCRPQDWERLATAVSRIGAARDQANGR